MTELQIAIGHLKETISVGNVLLGKMEKEQKDLEKPIFPCRFVVVKDDVKKGEFLIGLRQTPACPMKSWPELPVDFVGRVGFIEDDLRQIIKGLQTLLGESNDRKNELNY